jgi:hypothetical protein
MLQPAAGREPRLCELRCLRLDKLKHVPPNRLSEKSAKSRWFEFARLFELGAGTVTRCPILGKKCPAPPHLSEDKFPCSRTSLAGSDE